MRVVRFLPLAFVAAPLIAQSVDNAVPDPSPAVQYAIQGIGRTALGLAKIADSSWFQSPAATLGSVSTPEPSSRESACAIPLLEAPIPDQSNFPIRRVEPPVTENMKTTLGLPRCAPR
jgi:hypothetical protein